jgi:hypothetical protein
MTKTSFLFLQQWRTGRQNRSCLEVGTSRRGENIRKGIHGNKGYTDIGIYGNTMHSYTKMEKQDLLKLFQE